MIPSGNFSSLPTQFPTQKEDLFNSFFQMEEVLDAIEDNETDELQNLMKKHIEKIQDNPQQLHTFTQEIFDLKEEYQTTPNMIEMLFTLFSPQQTKAVISEISDEDILKIVLKMDLLEPTHAVISGMSYEQFTTLVDNTLFTQLHSLIDRLHQYTDQEHALTKKKHLLTTLSTSKENTFYIKKLLQGFTSEQKHYLAQQLCEGNYFNSQNEILGCMHFEEMDFINELEPNKLKTLFDAVDTRRQSKIAQYLNQDIVNKMIEIIPELNTLRRAKYTETVHETYREKCEDIAEQWELQIDNLQKQEKYENNEKLKDAVSVLNNFRESYEEEMDNNITYVYQDGKIQGFSDWAELDNCYHIHYLITHPDNLDTTTRQYTGTGTRLITHLTKKAWKSGYNEIQLSSLDNARSFYLKLGFEDKDPMMILRREKMQNLLK